MRFDSAVLPYLRYRFLHLLSLPPPAAVCRDFGFDLTRDDGMADMCTENSASGGLCALMEVH